MIAFGQELQSAAITPTVLEAVIYIVECSSYFLNHAASFQFQTFPILLFKESLPDDLPTSVAQLSKEARLDTLVISFSCRIWLM